MLEIIKRDCACAEFNREKITIAIEKAMYSSSGVYEIGLADKIALGNRTRRRQADAAYDLQYRGQGLFQTDRKRQSGDGSRV